MASRPDRETRARLRSLAAAGAFALALALVAAALLPGLARAQPGRDSPCGLHAAQPTAPALARLRDRVTVSSRVDVSCPEERRHATLLLAMDAGAPLREPPEEAPGSLPWGASALLDLGDRLELERHPLAALGIVAFGDGAHTACLPGLDRAALDDCAADLALGRGVRPVPGPGLADGIDESLKQVLLQRLRRAEASPSPSPKPAVELIVAVVDPARYPLGSAACERARGALLAARDEGVEVDLVCEGEGCARSCLGTLAGDPATNGPGSWSDAVGRMTRAALQTERRVAELTIFEHLHPSFTYLSARGEHQPLYDERAHRLTWKIDMLERKSVTLSYAVAPKAVGTLPLRRRPIGGFAVFADSFDAGGTGVLRNPVISVVEEPVTIALPIASRGLPGSDKPFVHRR